MAGAGWGNLKSQAYQRAIKNQPADAKVKLLTKTATQTALYTCTVMWD